MRSTLALVALAALAALAGGCGTSNPSPSNNAIVVDAHAHVATTAQGDSVTVEPERLIFPAAGNEALLTWAVGDPFVSGPRSPSATNDNPYGFLRKITGVHQDGATIVLDTEQAALTDVITDGDFETTVALPDTPGAVSTQALQVNANLGGQPLTIGPYDLNLLRITNELSVQLPKGQAWQVPVVASLGVKGAKIALTPRLQIGARIRATSLREFHVIADANLAAEIGLAVSAQLGLSAQMLDTDLRAGLAPRLQAAMERIQIAGDPPEVEIAPPIHLPPVTTMAGPIPVVTHLTVRFPLKCKAQFFGRFEGLVTTHVEAGLHLGVRYDADAGWTTEVDKSLDGGMDSTFKLGAGLEVQCSFKPTLDMFQYDVAGPTFALGPVLKGSAQYTETCDSTDEQAPSSQAEWKIGLGFQADLGMKVQWGFLGKLIGKTTNWKTEFTLINLMPISSSLEKTWTVDFGRLDVLGTCPLRIGACTQVETFDNGWPDFLSCTESYGMLQSDVDRYKPILRGECSAPGTNATWVDEEKCQIPADRHGGFCKHAIADGKWYREVFFEWSPQPDKITIDKDQCTEQGNTWEPF